jgi:hypothetical protein
MIMIGARPPEQSEHIVGQVRKATNDQTSAY